MAKKAEQEAAAEEQSPPVNRREFLSYAWAASIMLFMAQMGVVTYLYAMPRFKEGEFGGTFTLDAALVPPSDEPPVENPEGRFWLVRTDEGVKALYKVCTHLGCLYKWVEMNTRFECPCHGSKFRKDGTWIEGPAPRNLDQFTLTALDADGNELTKSEDNAALQLPEGTARIQVDTGDRIDGKPV